MNRTYEKALKLSNLYKDIQVIKWAESTNFDMIISTANIGLKTNDDIGIDFYTEGDKFSLMLYIIQEKPNFLKMQSPNLIIQKTEN